MHLKNNRLYKPERAILFLFYTLLFLSPLSIDISLANIQVSFPSEIITSLLGIFLFWWWVYANKKLPFPDHPVLLISGAYICWMGLTAPLSSMPLVSAKYFIAEAGQWWVFFIGFFFFFKKKGQQSILWWNGIYMLAFLPVILYAWKVHQNFGFGMNTSNIVARPFYFDHTMYSACMCMLAPIFSGFTLFPKTFALEKWHHGMVAGFSILLWTGIYLSFCRAAWLSVLLALFLLIILLFRIRFWHLTGVFLAILLLTFIFQSEVLSALKFNESESKTGTLWEQVLSIGNIQTDVSNMERLNRYSCAWRMFKEKPLTGFGAGTFPLQYLPFQRPEEMTRISVTDTGPHPEGRGGSTHSEYLQALSELGLPGLISWLLLFLLTLYYGMKVYYTAPDRQTRLLGLTLLLALSTYFFHAGINNFLHTGKVAILFWGNLAAVVSLSGKPSFFRH